LLQSNAAVLEKARLQKDRQAILNVPFTEKYLNRIGISLEKVDQHLRIIHVSGTKVNAFKMTLLLMVIGNLYNTFFPHRAKVQHVHFVNLYCAIMDSKQDFIHLLT